MKNAIPGVSPVAVLFQRGELARKAPFRCVIKHCCHCWKMHYLLRWFADRTPEPFVDFPACHVWFGGYMYERVLRCYHCFSRFGYIGKFWVLLKCNYVMHRQRVTMWSTDISRFLELGVLQTKKHSMFLKQITFKQIRVGFEVPHLQKHPKTKNMANPRGPLALLCGPGAW